MKILLILPANEPFRVISPDGPVPKRKMLRFSILPLTTIAALTPDDYEVQIIDENVEYLDLETPADLVGVTFMTALAPRAFKIAVAFRQRGIPVVAGGYHPTFCPEETARVFDAVVVGEAELHWRQVVEDARRGKLKKIYRADCACDPAEIPVPRRDLMRKTAGKYVTINALQTGRGCRNHCRYCSITAFHQGLHRSRPIENVLNELKRLPRGVIFIDDNIIADRPFIRELFTRMIPLKKRWVSQSSIDLADDPELLNLAQKSGCIGLFIGVESINARNLTDFDKEFNTPALYRKRIAALHQAGIMVFTSIIVGGENDDESVFETMLRFLLSVSSDGLQLNIMTPLPGTPLFTAMDCDGRITDYDWSKYDFRHVVIQPKLMSAKTLQGGADWLYVQFYRLDRILLRTLSVFLRSGWAAAWIAFNLGLTYRYDNIREGLPAKAKEWRREIRAVREKVIKRRSVKSYAEGCRQWELS